MQCHDEHLKVIFDDGIVIDFEDICVELTPKLQEYFLFEEDTHLMNFYVFLLCFQAEEEYLLR